MWQVLAVLHCTGCLGAAVVAYRGQLRHNQRLAVGVGSLKYHLDRENKAQTVCNRSTGSYSRYTTAPIADRNILLMGIDIRAESLTRMAITPFDQTQF